MKRETFPTHTPAPNGNTHLLTLQLKKDILFHLGMCTWARSRDGKRRFLTSGAGLNHRPELPLLLDLGQDPVVERLLLGWGGREAALWNLIRTNDYTSVLQGKDDRCGKIQSVFYQPFKESLKSTHPDSEFLNENIISVNLYFTNCSKKSIKKCK